MFIEKLYNVHLNDRNSVAIWHLYSCPHGQHKSDSRGQWLVRLTESEAKAVSRNYKSQYCSKCGS